jgi:hypothetical protein
MIDHLFANTVDQIVTIYNEISKRSFSLISASFRIIKHRVLQ